MATNNRSGKKIVEWADRGSAKGSSLDTATFIGIIKNNLDPTRSGRLQVWIPDLGGNESDSNTWRTVSYASPFFGSTYNPTAPEKNDYKNTQHTYGFWAVPPDVNNQVLCTFVNGDPGRGYWFACIHTQMVSHYMVPGIAAGNQIESDTADANVKKYIDTQNGTSGVPVVEFNENNPDSINSNFYNNKKPVHEEQFKQLLEQGLDKDRMRGSITSSSQRESPSTVFGISTPGRLLNDTATSDEFQQALEGDALTDELFTKYSTGARKGGHQFVMDDGDLDGIDNLVRLRSAAGHQILMNDQKRVMYIANASGSVWLEFADNGQMHVFSSGGMNFRSEGDINLHSDKNINITAKEKLNITGVNEFNFESNAIKGRSFNKMTLFANEMGIGSEGDLHLYADGVGNFQAGGALSCVGSKIQLNSGGGKAVAAPAKLPTMVHSDASRDDPAGPWKSVPRSMDSLCSIVPSHEPWNRVTGVDRITGTPPDGFGTGSGAQDVSVGGAPEKIISPSICEPKGAVKKDPQGKNITDGNGNVMRESVAEADPGPKLAATQPGTKLMPKDTLNRDDIASPPGGIGPLSQFQVKCLMAQLAYSESNFSYDLVDSTSTYIGRYQLGAYALQDVKYIKPEYVAKYNTSAIRYPDAWYGTDSITSSDAFLAAKGTQEKIMYTLLKQNYEALIKKSNDKYGIDPNDDLCTVAGMLAVSLLLGPGGARTWRLTGGGDVRATSAAAYYNRGRYAIDGLSNGGNTVTGTTTTRVDKSGLTPAAQAALAANINPDDVLTFTPFVPGKNTGSGSKEKFLAMTPEFKAMVLGAAREFKEKTQGQKLHVNSALRTQEDQTKLYTAWREAGGKYESEGGPTTVGTQYGRLSKPGQRVGNHGGGTAQDSPDNQVAKMKALGLFEKYGLQSVANDPPHLQRPKR
jgi:hypothetical protein